MKKLNFLLSMLITCLSAEFNAQTLDVNFTGTCNYYMGLSSTQIDAQSFTAGLTGALTKVSFDVSVDNPAGPPVNANNQPISSMSFTAQIYNGDGCSGTLLSSQTFSIPFNTSRTFYDINFASPAQLLAGQTYTIKITPTPGETYEDPFLMMGSENVFARWYMTGCSGSPTISGTPYVNCNSYSNDYFFKTYVSTGNLGVTNTKADKEISIFPNPAINTLGISGQTIKENYTINDFSGKQIVSGTVLPNQEINISKLISGNYILKLGNKIIKFIKK